MAPGGSTNGIQPSLPELLQQEPAINSTQAYLINTALLHKGTAGIYDLCLLLVNEDKRIMIRAEYALNSLAMFVAGPELADERRIFLQGIYQALRDDQLGGQRPLLIGLLKICGDDSSIKPLAVLLRDDSLVPLVAPALQQIGAAGGTSAAAGGKLLAALPGATPAGKAAIIQSLGQLKFNAAADRLAEFVKDPDTTVSSSAISALAGMGHAPLRSFLLERISAGGSTEYRRQAILNYLQLIGSLSNRNLSAGYCREILANDANLFSGHDRLVALTVLVDISGTAALPDVLNFSFNSPAGDQLTIISLLEKMNTAAVISSVSAEKDKFPASWWAGFINMLGDKKEADPSIKFFNESLQDRSVVVRSAAVKAILKIKVIDAVPFLLPLMSQEGDSTVLLALYDGLITRPIQDLFPYLISHYGEMTAGVKQVVLELLAERRDKNYKDLVMDQVLTGPAELRKTALRVWTDLADAEDLPVLFNLLQINSGDDQEILLKSILSLIERCGDDPKTDQAIADYARQNMNSDRGFLLRMLKQSGDDSALQILRAELNSENKERGDLARRTLCEWPGFDALDDLMKLAGSQNELTYRVLATRACLRLLQENDLGKEIELDYYKTLLQSAPRPEEKELVLAAMADLKSTSSLQYLTTLLSDPHLGSGAVQTILNMVHSLPDSGAELRKADITRILLHNQLKNESVVAPKIVQDGDSVHNQPPPGFVALFNGKDLTGWQGLVADPPGRSSMSSAELQAAQRLADQNMTKHWRIIDGVLCFDGHGENLCTVKNYKNFELRLDWKIEKNGDSGIYLRGSPQVQIWDPASSGTGSGGLYNNQIGPSLPLQFADRPVGEWNTFRIIMRGSRVTVYLNEILVVDNVVLENYWERDKPIYNTGSIELQAHYNPLYFRNIFIRALPDQEALLSGDLFNGHDLTGWQIIDGDLDSWQVQDTILYTTGKDYGWLSTGRTFGDFQLELEFRLPPGGNSGIFIRAPRQGDPAYTGMEIQLLDDYSPQYKDLKPWQYCGSIYGIKAPALRAGKSAGTWQKIVIACRGQYIKVMLNDVLIIDADLALHMDQEKTHPGIKRRSGYIGLQNHSTRVEFRNIRIHEFE